jgi:hypothetical protein
MSGKDGVLGLSMAALIESMARLSLSDGEVGILDAFDRPNAAIFKVTSPFRNLLLVGWNAMTGTKANHKYSISEGPMVVSRFLCDCRLSVVGCRPYLHFENLN